MQENEGQDVPKSGTYHGETATEALGHINVYLRYDTTYGKVSGDFCSDGRYLASFRCDLVDGETRSPVFRMVNSMLALDWGTVSVSSAGPDALDLVCVIPGIVPVFGLRLSYEGPYFRKLEIQWFTPNVDLGAELTQEVLAPRLVAHLRAVGIEAEVRTGLPRLPVRSPMGHRDLERWEERELHQVMVSRAPAISTPELWRLALLFVPRCDNGPIVRNDSWVDGITSGTRGVMFDRRKGNVSGLWEKALQKAVLRDDAKEILERLRSFAAYQRHPLDNEVVRQGAAIFYRYFQEEVPEERRGWECLHTLLHEIGHLFNLSHHDQHTHDEGTSVMDPRPDAPNRTLEFFDEDIIEIRHGFFDDVAPGGATDFLGMSGEKDVKSASEGFQVALATPHARHPMDRPLPLTVTLGPRFVRRRPGALRILVVKPYAGSGGRPAYAEYVPYEKDLTQVPGEDGGMVVTVGGLDLAKLRCRRPGRYQVIAGMSDPDGRYLIYGPGLDVWLTDGGEPGGEPAEAEAPESLRRADMVTLPLGRMTRRFEGGLGEMSKTGMVQARQVQIPTQAKRDETAFLSVWQFKDHEPQYRLHFTGLAHEGVLRREGNQVRLSGYADGRRFEGRLQLALDMDVRDEGGERPTEILSGTATGNDPGSGGTEGTSSGSSGSGG